MNAPYTLLTSEAEYRQACDTVLGRVQRELLIFDRDLGALQLESRARLDLLSGFLQEAPCAESVSYCTIRSQSNVTHRS